MGPLLPAGASPFAPGAGTATPDTVHQGSVLACRISAGFAGFSTPDCQSTCRGLDVDYCRAITAAV